MYIYIISFIFTCSYVNGTLPTSHPMAIRPDKPARALGDREAEDNHQDGAENEGRDDQGIVLQAPRHFQHFQPLKPGGSSWGFQKRNMGNTMGIVFPNDFIPGPAAYYHRGIA